LFASPREKETITSKPPSLPPKSLGSKLPSLPPKSYRYRNRPTTVFDEDLTNPEEGPRNYRMPFRYGGGADAGAGSGFGGGGSSGGSSGGNTDGNKGGNKGDRRGVTSMRDSGMVQGSTGYGPAGAGGAALGPSGNQGGNQDTTQDTTTTFNSPSFSPTYDYTPLKEDSLLDDVVDTFTDITTFNTPLGELSITPKSLTSFEAKLSFKKGGLLDRSSKK
jgi:hypothetical protein